MQVKPKKMLKEETENTYLGLSKVKLLRCHVGSVRGVVQEGKRLNKKSTTERISYFART